MRIMRNAEKIRFESLNRPLVRPRQRWEDNIKMDLRKIGFRGVD
jgi:hypothetical protein